MTARFIAFFLQKALRAVLTILVIVTLVFVGLRLAGDPTTILLGTEATPEMEADLRRKLSLDQPIWVQYFSYLTNILTGDFGSSFIHDRDALELVLDRLPATLVLMGTSLGLAILIGIPAGILAALRRGRKADRAIMSLAVLAHVTPNFFLGVLLMLVFSIWLRMLPTSGGETFQHLILPAFTIGASYAAVFARFTRSSMLEVLGSKYMLAAESRNVRRSSLIVNHALPNASIPILTIFGFMFGGMISGAIITESVFAWPGIGRLFVSSVANRDIPVVQVIVFLAGAAMVATNLVVDIAYGWLDPRIRLGRSA